MKDERIQVGDRFEIRARLGEGAMGVVYEAFDRERQEAVALKALHRADGLRLARFKREFHALHDLSHPNLVALGELFDRGSDAFFTMELVRGRDLLSYVRERAGPARDADPREPRASASSWSEPTTPGPHPIQPVPFDEPRLRSTFRQLALAIAALHQAGRLHRDVKPSNTLVTGDGRLVLLDFGLVTEQQAAPSPLSDSEIVGTVDYMAPEQAIGVEIGPAADWYSFGVVLFEALTGVLPFRGRTAFEVLMKKQEQLAPPPRQLFPDVPPDLDDLCTRLLRIQPGDRPQERDVFGCLGIDAGHEHRRASSSLGSRAASSAAFVGRVAELERMRAAYQRSRLEPVILLVEGPSGVGKTQLVDTFLRQLAGDEPDVVVLGGRCYEREVVSYKALDGIAEALARHLTRLSSVEAAALLPLEPSLVARLFPVLKRVAAIAAAPVEPDLPDPLQQRQRMFGALRELFLRLRERHRMVWFIDDLQWADADSFVLLQELVAHEEPLPVLLVATLRPVADRSRQDLLAHMVTLASTERIRLDNLPAADARELAGLLLPGRPPDVLDAVTADAGGHPMFLHELARHVGLEAGEALACATLDEMLASRIAQLSTPARRLLEVVCLYGGPMAQQVAALATEQSDAEQTQVARVLQAAHLVRTEGVHRTDHIVAYHDRVREHVSERLSADRRRSIHERLALALEQSGAAALDPRALVRHARAAGLSSLAATHALRAARQAVASLAFDQASEFFKTALELGRHDEARARALRIELGDALVNAGRGPEAATTFLEAAEGAEPAVRLDCQRKAAEQWILTGHIERGLDAMRTSLADIGESLAPTPRRALLEVLWNRALLRARGMRYVLRRESQVAEETLRRIDVVRAVALGLSVVDNIRGAAFSGRFIRMALGTGEPTRLVQAMCAEATYLASQGGHAGRRARLLLGEVASLQRMLADEPFVASWRHGAEGTVSYFESRFAAAEEALAKCEAASMLTPRATTFERNTARVFRLFALRQLGALNRGRALFAESMRSARQRGDRYIEASLQLMCNRELLALDDTDGARRSLGEARWAPPEVGFHVQHWYELRSRAELALYEGTAAEALTALDSRFEGLRRSLLLRVQVVRCKAASLRGRLLLAALAEGRGPAGARAEVARLAHQLVRERLGCAEVFGLLLRAGLAAVDRGPTHAEVVGYLRDAAERAEQQEMTLHLAAARERRGALLGADEGERLRAGVAAYVAAESVRVPARLFEVVAPGFDRG